MERQVAALRFVRDRSDVPVPSVPWFEPDGSGARRTLLRHGADRRAAVADVPPYVFGSWVTAADEAQRSRDARRRRRPARRHPRHRRRLGRARPVGPGRARSHPAGASRRAPAHATTNGSAARRRFRSSRHLRSGSTSTGHRTRATGHQLGRLAPRQRAVARLRAGRGPRLGGSGGRPSRARPRLADLLPRLLPADRRALRARRASRTSSVRDASSTRYAERNGPRAP